MTSKKCNAALMIKGERFQCDLEYGHEEPYNGKPGLGHCNMSSQSMWSGSSEPGEWKPMRTGRSVYRTLYLDEVLVGLMDTPDLAEEVSRCWNLRHGEVS